jgi:hypothetical protein
MERDFCLFKNVQTYTGTRPVFHAVCRWLCRGLHVKLVVHVNLVPTLKMSGRQILVALKQHKEHLEILRGVNLALSIYRRFLNDSEKKPFVVLYINIPKTHLQVS